MLMGVMTSMPVMVIGPKMCSTPSAAPVIAPLMMPAGMVVAGLT